MTNTRSAVYYYIGGVVIWFFGLCVTPSDQQSTNVILINFLSLTIGVAAGFLGHSVLLKRPWLAFFLPFISLIVVIFN